MSAEALREAAALIREEWSPSEGRLFCHCDDTDSWFDRSICPEPCDSMHNICVECGRVQGYCSVAVMGRDNGNRLTASWLAVADWLEVTAETRDAELLLDHSGEFVAALAVARAYLGT